MSLKSKFRFKLLRLYRAIDSSLSCDCVSSDLIPSLFAVFSYMWQRPSHRFHTSDCFIDTIDNGKSE